MTAAGRLPVILTGAEVAAKFGVTQKTVQRWADKGLIGYFCTPGGKRRYYAVEIDRLLRDRFCPVRAAS